ncbi:hypothetical protein ACFL08_02900 [Patescibacteria group bacterium]
MARYKIFKNKIQIADLRFDEYLSESLLFFDKLESLLGSPPSILLTDTQDVIEERNRLWSEFGEAIENCRHKIRAINYNISLIKSEIENPPIPQFESFSMNLDKKEFLDDVVLFEFESFLFQVISSLDVFVYLLKLFYPTLNSGRENEIGFKGMKKKAGKKTVKILRKAGEVDLANYIEGQSREWIQKVYDLRNTVVHRSKVQDLQMFLIEDNGVAAPKLLDSETDLLEYCEEVYEKFKVFLNTIESDYLLGKAGDFYDAK